MITLFPDQIEFVEKIRQAFRSHKRVLGQAATGFGKTVVGTHMCKRAVDKAPGILWTNHRDFLLDQTSATFSLEGIPHSFMAAGRKLDPTAPVWIASVGSIRSRAEKIPAPRFVVIDECHHTAAGTWAAILERWPDAHVLGLTATPQRLDGKGLDAFFDHMVLGPPVAWLIDNGRLSKYRAFSLGSPDLSKVRVVAGDYDQEEVARIMDQRQLRGDTVAHYRKYALGKRAVYFGVTVAHSKNLAETFRSEGIAAEHLDAHSPSVERIAAAKRLASGETSVLCNVDIFGEGYDLSAQAGQSVSVEVVGLCRPTHSLVLHLQQVGRALRPKSEPAIILDHAGNLLRHGLPDQERAWSLKGKTKAKKGEVTEPDVKECPECYAVVSRNVTVCPECGHVFEATKKVLEITDGELVELKRVSIEEQRAAAERLKRERKEEEWRAKSVVELAAIGRRRGYKYPEQWAVKLWSIRESRRRQWQEKRTYGAWN